ncbi:MAG: hypothetical protein HC881_12770 [Leptolyngbyaceae cyanobacterium SL_7_1]|nr:hypothetical protein [Leptolyngbyaceae cyanobacterium SL_7_1]
MNCPITIMTSSDPFAIKDPDYSVQYDPKTQTVTFQGELQLSGMDDYAPIIMLLDDAVEQESSLLKLDLRGLKFLNSSGINMLLRLVIKVRDRTNLQLVVQGSEKVSWQSRSLKTLKRLMPGLELQME